MLSQSFYYNLSMTFFWKRAGLYDMTGKFCYLSNQQPIQSFNFCIVPYFSKLWLKSFMNVMPCPIKWFEIFWNMDEKKKFQIIFSIVWLMRTLIMEILINKQKKTDSVTIKCGRSKRCSFL